MENETEQQHSWTFKAKRFLVECKRVLIVTKKPTSEEFKAIVKVSGIGILVIGFMGFLIHMIAQFITG
ncbi:MAG: protein translocase SEC61 complex subunit gamma [Candidatus Woesearchaeota archaeon]|jgi:protein transport protein SEC61 subunit gamma-like protein